MQLHLGKPLGINVMCNVKYLFHIPFFLDYQLIPTNSHQIPLHFQFARFIKYIPGTKHKSPFSRKEKHDLVIFRRIKAFISS